MKTLLVIASQPVLATALRAALAPELFRVLAPADLPEAEALLRQGLADVCVVDAQPADRPSLRLIERLRRLLPALPVFVYASQQPWQWTEEAYLAGATQVLTHPVRAPLLRAFLDRLWPEPAAQTQLSPPRLPLSAAAPVEASAPSLPTLEALRNFSSILRHCLDPGALLREFLVLVREIVGVNRAAIFLRAPQESSLALVEAPADRRCHAACALGIPPAMLSHFALSLDAGIGGYVFRTGRILKQNSDEAVRDWEIRKEFEVLGGQVALPIPDGQSLLGLVVLDGHLTGEHITNEELSLLFHLLEQVGMALKNSQLHDQLAANHEMMTDILSQFGSGCVVVGSNLKLLHANRMARSLFGQPAGPATLEFWELPQPLASPAFEVLKTGQEAAPFEYRPEPGSETVYHVKIVPFFQRGSRTANAALLVLEDYTQAARAQKLEIESANLHMVRSMAARLAHEIGNALVPISTQQQLLSQQYDKLGLAESLNQEIGDSVHRISRLAKQMLYLARDVLELSDTIPLGELFEEAFAQAQAHFPEGKAQIVVENALAAYAVFGNRAALTHAVAELLLNAFQANPKNPQVRVRIHLADRPGGGQDLHVALRDSGSGFAPEAVQKAGQPFFSTRAVGLGLGLAVARKIISAHHGALYLAQACSLHRPPGCPACSNQEGSLCLFLPLKSARETAAPPTPDPAPHSSSQPALPDPNP